MSLVVLTGGARSGKSSVAQGLAEQCKQPVTVVVFGGTDDDAEMLARVERHRAERPSHWITVEATDSAEWVRRVGDGPLMIDCLGTLLGRVMEEVYAEYSGRALNDATELPSEFESEVERRFAALVGWVLRRFDQTIVVTNEVGDGLVPAYPSGRVFRDVLGRANRSLVERAELSYLVVAGRCIELSSLSRGAKWPKPQACE